MGLVLPFEVLLSMSTYVHSSSVRLINDKLSGTTHT